MNKIEIEPWEPEETVGKLWHAFASRLDAPEVHHGAAVDFNEVVGRLAVLFRGLGGNHGVEIRPVSEEASGHRLSFSRRLGTETEFTPNASFDGEVLRLPAKLAVYASRDANSALYIWLTAAVAHAPDYYGDDDPLRADLRALQVASVMVEQTLAGAPGLKKSYSALCEGLLQQRPQRPLPNAEAAVDAVIRHMLGETRQLSELATTYKNAIQKVDFTDLSAPRGYKPYRPVALWPVLRAVEFNEGESVETRDTDGTPESSSEKMLRAKRHKSDQAERNDSLILHKFEAILSWTEFLNLNRRVEDDDEDSAKKAAEDQEEIGLGQVSKAPATRLKLHLDLAPEDVDRERLSGKTLYPEWDARTGVYLKDHVCVLTSDAQVKEENASFTKDARTARRIRSVKRQFEALRPGRVTTRGHLEGDELDMDTTVRSSVERVVTGEGSERIWLQTRPEARDLAVSILLDVSRSTESAVADRTVIDIEREALAALAWGLDACGDDFAITAFSSLKRNRVYLQNCKHFGEAMSQQVEMKIGSLRPGFYTRLGAAIRHSSQELAAQSKKRRLLLVITDGKPNDLDHYEGRHGIEDTRMAVHEARRIGQSVFGITIDKSAKSWFPRLFGQGGFAVIPEPDKLTQALPEIYRHLVGG
ncbi:von Willebrand factor type A domain protein [Pseudovibrio axinellae]|uniref:von Willebrand factor type A domain protein n=1 Tax=Pseudovibrio axinellae TaxID=989403 RepID=A0A165T1U4_9HYPH|nr:VWA domain-containing protein [Pseudovibrio axinellae]KZL05182.1 von Willebrand factor type A domain protein [Pseudovibrio axinellae]SER51381.1 nitric oxide reductase NorD protein [Pseudovibrio axinellae]